MGAAAGEPTSVAKDAGVIAAAKSITLNGVRVSEREEVGNIIASGKEWNTRNLGKRLTVDLASAAAAGGLVAPIISIIDKAIIENASGRRPMMPSIQASISALIFSPHRFLASKPFALIFMLYTGTYFTANCLDTYKSTVQNKHAASTTSGPAKFLATTTTNLSLCLYKDSQFTKMFGTVSARPIPGPSYALFAARDCLTIFASFNLPALIAPSLPLSEASEKYISRTSTAQFLAPAAIQLISTPFHLLGLDLYNRNGGTKFSDRMTKVRVDWLKSSLARMCRIVPAFGVGGVVNNSMRARSMNQFD
ncbi:putative membrane protein [Acrodontium crateriforme]|uniref:Membrane protein n=1 Tax=Acrodontium crateriforme TaxID=150365 RepID=A0AAQ3M0V0_9PEZI|nr:putative membrane protein [Acrodontium crateriforme]